MKSLLKAICKPTAQRVIVSLCPRRTKYSAFQEKLELDNLFQRWDIVVNEDSLRAAMVFQHTDLIDRPAWLHQEEGQESFPGSIPAAHDNVHESQTISRTAVKKGKDVVEQWRMKII